MPTCHRLDQLTETPYRFQAVEGIEMDSFDSLTLQ